jgi:phosphatidylserine/phosphatidylglycerophosphate/cardiolipin synthase-like enzyme
MRCIVVRAVAATRLAQTPCTVNAMSIPRRPIPLPLVLLALAALVGAYLAAEQLRAPRLPEPSGPSLLDRGAARVYFTTPSLAYPDVEGRRPASPLLEAVLADLRAARRSIDLAVFDLDLEPIGAALEAAARRGVAVRVVLDSSNLEAAEVSALAGRLQLAGVPLRFDRRAPFMHHKFIVLDEAVLWTGSWNLTANDTYRNHNNMVRLTSAALARSYSAAFDGLFDGRFGQGGSMSAAPCPGDARAGGGCDERQTPVGVFFSPEGGAEAEVLRRLEDARESIWFLAFSFTSRPIAEAMTARAADGLVVAGVVERQNAAGTGSALPTLLAGGVAALEDGGCYLLHHKVIIIDDRVVITGSYNFTGGAERSNDENMLVIEDAGLARAYREEFERLYALAHSPMRCG